MITHETIEQLRALLEQLDNDIRRSGGFDETQITHWNCGDFPDEVMSVEKFVDDNVYDALRHFASELSVLVSIGSGSTFDPDTLCVYLAEGRPDAEGKPTSITANVSLKDSVLQLAADADERMHPEDMANALKMAEHLEAIARELRGRLERAAKSTHE